MKVTAGLLARRRVPRAAGFAALLIAAMLGGCASLVAGRPNAIFDLTAPGGAAPARGNAQILVPEPKAVRALDTDRIAARPDTSQYAYLPGAVWSDRLPKLLQMRLVETLQNSGRARAVAVPGQGLLIDYQVILDVRAFEYTGEGAVADFEVRVMDDRNGRVARSRTFRQVVPVAGTGTGAIVQALDQAMDAAFVEIANWALG